MRKFFTLILFILLGISSVWAEHAKKEEGTWEGNRAWSGLHANFRLDGENSKDGQHLDVVANSDQVITWTVDEGYIINVTAIKIKVGHSFLVHGGTSCDIYINNVKVWNVGTTTGSEKEFTGYNLGNDGSLTLKFSTKADLYYIDITYDINPITYYMAFHGNGNNGGEMANQAIQYDASTALTANAFTQKYTFTYNANGGTCDESSKEIAYDFQGWASTATGEVVYADKAVVKNLTTVDGKVFDLYAVWTPNSITLPTPTRDGFVFDGWYDAEDNYLGKAGDVITPTKSLSLTAKWADMLTPMFVLDKTAIEIDETAKLTLDNVSAPTITFAPEGIVEYNAETGVLTGLAKGEVTITIEQKATATIKYKKEDLKLTVNKITPSMTVLLDGVEQNTITLNAGQNAEVEIQTNSDAKIAVERIEGKSAAYAEGFVEALYEEGTTTFRATIDETDRYLSGSIEFAVTVEHTEEATDCYVLEDNELVEWATIGRTKEYAVNGPAEQLKFQARRVALLGVSNNSNFFAEYSTTTDDDSWTRLEPYMDLPDKDKWYTFTYDIPENTKRVRMRSQTGAEGYRCIQNVKVTRKTYLKAEDVAIELFPQEDGNGTLTVDYSLANGGDLKIISDNDQFSFEPATIENVDCKSGKANIPFTFAAQEEQKTYIANVTIYNAVYTKTVQLSAKVRKLDPVISWDNIDLKEEESIELAATCDQPEAEIQYEIVGETDVIRLENGKIYAEHAGEAQVRAFIESSVKFNAAERIIDVHVMAIGKQAITWEQDLSNIKKGDIVELKATASSKLDVTYTSSDESIAKIENGKLIAVKAGTVTITATQEGNEEYDPAEPVVRVINISDPLDTRDEQEIYWFDDLPMLGTEDDDYQIIAYASSGLEVSFISSDSTIAYVDEYGWIIIQNRPGKVEITAIQEGDESYKPAEPITKTLYVLDVPSAIENEQAPVKAVKILRDGRVLILREGKEYTISGQVL